MKMRSRRFKRRECNSRCASCRAVADFRHSFVLRHLCFVILIVSICATQSNRPILGPVFSLTMLGSGSAGNSALVATDHCKILVDGGLSARQLVLRLEQCGVAPEQLDGVLLTHEHGDHVCGLEVLCRKFDVPIYCNRLTAEALRCTGFLGQIRNWRIFETGAEFSICDVTVQTFPVPHDAVDPLGFVFHAGSGSLGFITDLGYVTKLIIERLRQAQTLVIETNHDEKLLQKDTHRPWPVKQRIQSRHGHLSNTSAAGVIEDLLPGKIERVFPSRRLAAVCRLLNHSMLGVRRWTLSVFFFFLLATFLAAASRAVRTI